MSFLPLILALVVATSASVIASLGFGFLGNGLGTLSAAASLGIGAAVGLAAGYSARGLPRAKPVRGWIEWALLIGFALFAIRGFCWVAYYSEGNIAFLIPNNLGDLSLHITFIRTFANGVSFWPANPIFASLPLHYPVGMDLFNALLLLVGVDLLRGLVWVGLIASVATGATLWRWGGAFALAGFLFNGGTAGLEFFSKGGELFDYQSHVAWKSIPLTLFLTQRGLLYAIPAGLLLFWSWRRRLLKNEKGLPIWVEVFLYGTMPIFHLHTFLVLSLVLAAWGVGDLWQFARTRKVPALLLKAGGVVAMAFIPATLLVGLVTGGTQTAGAFWWKPGWMQNDDGFLPFWFTNFGFFPFAVAALVLWNIQRLTSKGARGDREAAKVDLALSIPAILLFLTGCFVMFAPWEWDNTKVFLWCYLLLLPPLWDMISKTPFIQRAVLCILLFFSGALSLVGGINSKERGYTLASRKELDELAVAVASLPKEAIFAGFPTYNHPLLLLGRKMVMGYEGHLASHAVDYSEEKAALETLLKGEPEWQAGRSTTKADYLFWGPREEEAYGEAPLEWKHTLPRVAEGPWGAIYDLRGTAASGSQ